MCDPGVLGFVRHPGVLEAGVLRFSRFMDAGQVRAGRTIDRLGSRCDYF
ncbi:MAG: hypothetical protein JW748_12555 [Anaerolineales bacterium]|nr:hypothetical protein [Anaerolineales bacterium]